MFAVTKTSCGTCITCMCRKSAYNKRANSVVNSSHVECFLQKPHCWNSCLQKVVSQQGRTLTLHCQELHYRLTFCTSHIKYLLTVNSLHLHQPYCNVVSMLKQAWLALHYWNCSEPFNVFYFVYFWINSGWGIIASCQTRLLPDLQALAGEFDKSNS